MTTNKDTGRPPIHMINSEANALSNLALSAENRMPEVSQLLLDEIARASIHAPDAIAPDVVTMNSIVEFIDEGSGTKRTIELVYPRAADISAGRISILTPVGAGLIGLRTGQSILWPDRDGRERKLTIVDVRKNPAKS